MTKEKIIIQKKPITIKVLRLKVGLDIVTQLEASDRPGYVKLHFPFRPMYSINEDTNVSIIQLVHWMNFELFADVSQCEILESDILLSGDASETMSALYMKSLGSFQAKLENGDYSSKVKSMGEILSKVASADDKSVDPVDLQETILKRKLQ